MYLGFHAIQELQGHTNNKQNADGIKKKKKSETYGCGEIVEADNDVLLA